MAFSCRRNIISISAFFIFLCCIYFLVITGGIVNPHYKQYYNEFWCSKIITITSVSLLAAGILCLGSCCTSNRIFHAFLGGILIFSSITTAATPIICFFFPDKLLNDPDLWQRAWSNKNPQDIAEVIEIENNVVCCGYGLRSNWDTARCAAYLNPDFIEKWLNGGVPDCKTALVGSNNFSDNIHIIILAIMAVFILILSFIACSVVNSKEEQENVPLLQSEEAPAQYTEKQNL